MQKSWGENSVGALRKAGRPAWLKQIKWKVKGQRRWCPFIRQDLAGIGVKWLKYYNYWKVNRYPHILKILLWWLCDEWTLEKQEWKDHVK